MYSAILFYTDLVIIQQIKGRQAVMARYALIATKRTIKRKKNAVY